MNTALAVLIFIASSVSSDEKTVLYSVFPLDVCKQIVSDIREYGHATKNTIHVECQPIGMRSSYEYRTNR